MRLASGYNISDVTLNKDLKKRKIKYKKIFIPTSFRKIESLNKNLNTYWCLIICSANLKIASSTCGLKNIFKLGIICLRILFLEYCTI